MNKTNTRINFTVSVRSSVRERIIIWSIMRDEDDLYLNVKWKNMSFHELLSKNEDCNSALCLLYTTSVSMWPDKTTRTSSVSVKAHKNHSKINNYTIKIKQQEGRFKIYGLQIYRQNEYCTLDKKN